MYQVTNWDTNEIIASAERLSTAKRLCRAQGHTGQGNGKYYLSVAMVRNKDGCCVYSPVFRVGKHDHLKAETFVVAVRDDTSEPWVKIDTRGSLNAASTLAKNTNAPMVAVFTAHQWGLDALGRAQFLRDNRDRGE